MSNKEQNSIVVPGFTAKASLNDATDEYRAELRTYMTKDLEHAIQLSMKPEDCHKICVACARAGRPCCVILLPDGTCSARCCIQA